MDTVVHFVLLVLHLSLPIKLWAASTPLLQCLKSPLFLPFFTFLPSFLSSSYLGHTVTGLYTGTAAPDNQQHTAPAQLFSTGAHSTPVTRHTHPLCAPVGTNRSRGWIGQVCVDGLGTWLHYLTLFCCLDICVCVFVYIVCVHTCD